MQLHDLNGFDMVYALTESTINAQFETLWGLEILPGDWDISSGSSSMQATMGVPTVNLLTNNQVKLTIPITGGTFSWYVVDTSTDPPQAVKQTADVAGAVLTLTTSLNIASLSNDEVRGSAVIPAEVKTQLQNFDDSMFSIEHIYMNLEDANLLSNYSFNCDQVDMTNADTVTALTSLVKAYIDGLKDSKNPYILGYQVTDSNTPSDATWKPTGVTYATFKDNAYPTRNSLNFLMETHGKTVPSAPVLSANWIQADDVEGTFVFSQELVLPQIIEAIPFFGLSINDFSTTDNKNFTYSGNGNTITVTLQDGENTVNIFFHIYFRQEVYDHSAFHSHIGYVDGYFYWTTQLMFEVDPTTHTINILPNNSTMQVDAQPHPNSLGIFEAALAIFADIIGSIITFGQANFGFTDMVNQDWNTAIPQLSNIGIHDVQSRIILPAGNELIFKDCRFQSDGSMMLTTTVSD